MKNKNNKRRGATITELLVVIAVIAIAAGMVATFSTMVSANRELSQARLDALQDIKLAETVIENFIEDAENNKDENRDVAISYPKGDETDPVYSLINGAGDILKFENGALNIYPGKDSTTNPLTINLETVTEITFDVLGNDDKIYYCTITYDIGGTPFDYTFCVNPYAGENI